LNNHIFLDTLNQVIFSTFSLKLDLTKPRYFHNVFVDNLIFQQRWSRDLFTLSGPSFSVKNARGSIFSFWKASRRFSLNGISIFGVSMLQQKNHDSTILTLNTPPFVRTLRINTLLVKPDITSSSYPKRVLIRVSLCPTATNMKKSVLASFSFSSANQTHLLELWRLGSSWFLFHLKFCLTLLWYHY